MFCFERVSARKAYFDLSPGQLSRILARVFHGGGGGGGVNNSGRVFTTTFVQLNIPEGVLFTDFVKRLKNDRCFHVLN